MKEGELSEVWRQMLEQEIDVLVCTTIIETGVDLPNANTLIIENADCMDFRSCISSEAVWAEVHEGHMPTLPSDGTRFSRRFSRKGLPQSGNLQNSAAASGIAMRDLELRGAGNIMGAQQHGHMESVGYDMYLKLLDEAVSRGKGRAECHKRPRLSY